jgi:UDP-glucose 4-epimerase
MNELARVVIETVGSASRVMHVPYDEAYEEGFEDMERRVPDVSKILELTGWEPKLGLDRILADVIAFERTAAATGA